MNSNSLPKADSLDLRNLKDRIKLVASLQGGNSALARKIDSAESTVRKWVNGLSEPKYNSLVAIAGVAGVELEWLMSGEGEMQVKSTSEDEDDIAAQKARAQKFLDLPESMWVNVDYELWECDEPNMEPTLHVGDVYIVTHHPPGNGVYLVDVGGCKKAMRLAVVPDGIKCSNDNPLYSGADFTIERNSNDVRVVGRVLRTGKDKRPA
jgi:phage repressor protein C with HTH and peptisase S24 domain